MMTHLALCLLGILCFLDAAASQDKFNYLCQLSDVPGGKDFPDIEKISDGSYIMTVEYTMPGVSQTDYYVEYYDTVNHLGRVDSYQDKLNLKYIYRAETWEAWNIQGRKCQLNNITDTPEFFRGYQTSWRYDPEQIQNRTRGPSSMFKKARDAWFKQKAKIAKDVTANRTMGYLGEMPHSHIRGENAQIWRLCESENTSVDFYFTTDDVDNAYNVKSVPLRVTFNGVWEGDQAKLSEQSYDIISFQPYITPGQDPFELPKGMGCGRAEDLADKEDNPKMPDFQNNMLFYSEVVYRKTDVKTQEDLGSYYSTLMFVIDRPLGMLAYSYSPWNKTKVKDYENIGSPEFVVYDLTYKYYYKMNYGTATCDIGRSRDFTPSYILPENGGYFDLNSPYVFFPNNEFGYLTKSKDRGVEVDVYEAVIENYIMNSETLVKNVIATHTYLKGDEKTDNVVSVKHTPVQIELRFSRDAKVDEIITFNIYGFTTKVSDQRRIFDVQRCFKNDDEYSWITIGFETAQGSVSSISGIDAVDLKYEMTKWFDTELDMKPIRVPTILVDIQDELYVTLLVLQKPTLQLDFTEKEANKKVDGVEGKGLMIFDTCARDCLENEYEKCWGFSLCGGICYIGGESNQKTVAEKNCTLYKRFSNDSYMRTKEKLIGIISEQIKVAENGKTISIITNDKEVILKATSILVTDPAVDDPTFNKMGNKYSDRMRVFKVGKKLKKAKSLGKLHFEECQRLCLDYQDCETISFCLINSLCSVTTAYGDEIKDEEMETNALCQIMTRKYSDNFEVNPGFFLGVDATKTIKNVKDSESCARSCLKEGGFQCLSLDLCGDNGGLTCRLHKSHFLKKDTRKESLTARATCRHYTRKYSVEFKKYIETKVKSENLKPLSNLGVEECAKTCMEYGQGACYAFDFCQGKTISESSCIIIDSDPARLGTVYSPVCTHYLRTEQEYAPRPYSNSYASGIGFLCFLVGGIIGVVVVFGIAYFRVNRQQ